MAVVVLSASNKDHDVRRALELGALGYIPKTTPLDVMLGALKLVLSGGTYIPPEILKRASSPTGAGEDAALRSPSTLGLTERQIEVLALLREGRTNKAIARALGVSEPTVKNHITAILKTLKVKSRTEAVIASGKLRLKSSD